MIALLRWLILVCTLLLPGALQAIPVGALTNAAGERVGMQDIPDWGDTPGKIHRRYCAERATLPAIWASTLMPNGIKSDRRMPAYESLDVRCTHLRASWKELPLSAQSSKELMEVKTELEGVKVAFAAAKAESSRILAELQSLKTEVKTIPQTVLLGMPVVPSSPPWWQEPVFWMVVLLVLLFPLMLALFLLLLRMRRSEQARAAERTSASLAATPPTAGSVWGQPASGGAARLSIAVWDESMQGQRLFQYSVPQQSDRSYTDILLRQWSTLEELGSAVYATLSRFCGNAMGGNTRPFDSNDVERAKDNGVLIEIPLVWASRT